MSSTNMINVVYLDFLTKYVKVHKQIKRLNNECERLLYEYNDLCKRKGITCEKIVKKEFSSNHQILIQMIEMIENQQTNYGLLYNDVMLKEYKKAKEHVSYLNGLINYIVAKMQKPSLKYETIYYDGEPQTSTKTYTKYKTYGEVETETAPKTDICDSLINGWLKKINKSSRSIRQADLTSFEEYLRKFNTKNPPTDIESGNTILTGCHTRVREMIDNNEKPPSYSPPTGTAAAKKIADDLAAANLAAANKAAADLAAANKAAADLAAANKAATSTAAEKLAAQKIDFINHYNASDNNTKTNYKDAADIISERIRLNKTALVIKSVNNMEAETLKGLLGYLSINNTLEPVLEFIKINNIDISKINTI